MDPHDYCVLDIETAGGSWPSFPEGFELLLTGLRYRSEDFSYTAEPQSLARLADFLEGFSGVMVTFNGEAFDLPILRLSFVTTLGQELHTAHHYDLLKEIQAKAGRRISLNDVSHYTFGEQKTPWDHRQNRRVWAEEPQRLIEYKRVDLDLTEKLYLRVLEGQHLYLGDATILLSPPGRGPAPP